MKRLLQLLTLTLLLAIGSNLPAQSGADKAPSISQAVDVMPAEIADQYNVSPVTDAAIASQRPRAVFASQNQVVDDPVEEPTNWLKWLADNWAMVLLSIVGIMEIVVRFIPTENDHAWLKWIKNLIDKLIPNNSTRGGTHP